MSESDISKERCEKVANQIIASYPAIVKKLWRDGDDQ